MDLLRVGHLERLCYATQISRNGSPVSNLGLSVRPAPFRTRCSLADCQYPLFQARRVCRWNCLDGRWLSVVLVLQTSSQVYSTRNRTRECKCPKLISQSSCPTRLDVQLDLDGTVEFQASNRERRFLRRQTLSDAKVRAV